MNVLIVIAHADDEVLGMGGTICKHIENGDDVYIIVATVPNESYSLEIKESIIKSQKEVDKFLGIRKRINLNYPTVTLNTIEHGKFNEKLSEYVDLIKPDIIYTHFKYDVNLDHGIVFTACLVATRPPKHIKLVCFETISETEWSDESFKPNYYIDISEYVDMKEKAFALYKSQIKYLPHPRNLTGIYILAHQRGLESGYPQAEAFKIIRWYD